MVMCTMSLTMMQMTVTRLKTATRTTISPMKTMAELEKQWKNMEGRIVDDDDDDGSYHHDDDDDDDDVDDDEDYGDRYGNKNGYGELTRCTAAPRND